MRDITTADYLRNRANLKRLEKRYISYVSPPVSSVPSSTSATVQQQPMPNQARALQQQQQQQQAPPQPTVQSQTQQAVMPYDSPSMECNPRSLAALAQQQHQRMAAAAVAAQQQTPQQQMYTSSGGRSNIFNTLLEGAQSSPAAAAAAAVAAVMAGNVHRGDSMYSYSGNDDSFRRKWDPALVAMQQSQSQQQSGRQQQQQQAVYQQVVPSGGIPHVVSAPQLVTSTQPNRELPHPGPAYHYEDFDLSTVRTSIPMEEIVQHLYAVSQAASGSNSGTAAKAFGMVHSDAVRAVIWPTIEKAIKDTLTNLAERSISLAAQSTEVLVRKDFAFNADPNSILSAAKKMARHLAAAHSCVNSRDVLNVSLCSGILNSILNLVKLANQQDKDAVELIAVIVANKTVPPALAYIQKSVAERAVREVEKRLEPELKLRQELGSRRYTEQVAHSLTLPECAQLNPHLLNIRMAVYQEFDRTIPSFAPIVSSLSPAISGSGHFGLPVSSSSTSAHQIFQRAAPGPMVPQQLSQQSQQQSSVNQSVAAKYLIQQQYIQQHAATVGSPQQQQQSQQSGSPMNLFDSIILCIRRHIANVSKLIPLMTGPQEHHPVLHCLQNLVDVVQMAKASGGNGATAAAAESAYVRIIAYLVHSLLSNYRPSQWIDQHNGLPLMEHLKESHMIALRHMLSCEQSSWVTRQVTDAWIQLPDTEAESIDQISTSSSNNLSSKVEQLSTLAFLAVTKSETEAAPSGVYPNRSADLYVKWNWEGFAELLKVHVLYLTQIDAYLASKVASGHVKATTFVLNLLDHFVLPVFVGSLSSFLPIDDVLLANQLASNTTRTISTQLGNIFTVTSKREFTVLNEYDLWLTIRALLEQQKGTLVTPGDFNLRLRISCARVRALMDWGFFDTEPLSLYYGNDSTENAALFIGCSRAREFDDTPTMKSKTENYFRWWVDVFRSSQDNITLEEQALSNLMNAGFLSSDETIIRFFRLTTILVIERSLNNLKQAEQAASSTNLTNNVRSNTVFLELDAYARLISFVVNRAGSSMQDVAEANSAKVALLNRVLGIIGGTLMQSHEVRPELFHPMPFERLLVVLYVDLYGAESSSPSEAAPVTTLKEEETQSLTLHEYIPIAFGRLLHMLRPSRMPKFILAYLEIISYRHFVSRLLGPASLSSKQHVRVAYRAVYGQLLLNMLNYLTYFLHNAVAHKHVNSLYVATFRLCLVLFHDFPGFMADYCPLFCNVISSSAIQLRNLILSSEPRRGSSSIDPLNASPVDDLAALEDPSGYAMEAGSRLPPVLRSEIDSYLVSRTPSKVYTDLALMTRRIDSVASLLVSPPELLTSALNLGENQPEGSGDVSSQEAAPPQPLGKKAKKAAAAKAAAAAAQQHAVLVNAAQQANMVTFWAANGSQLLSIYGLNSRMHYNADLMTDIVLYLCITAVKTLRESGLPLNMNTVSNSPQMEILQGLVMKLDDEGRYLLLNCMANQLRYLNSHTYYFSYSLLCLFAEMSMQKVKEQISRVLMERLIVNRPHPWGLLMTSAELLRNPVYRYWDHEFARCHKDMEE